MLILLRLMAPFSWPTTFYLKGEKPFEYCTLLLLMAGIKPWLPVQQSSVLSITPLPLGQLKRNLSFHWEWKLDDRIIAQTEIRSWRVRTLMRGEKNKKLCFSHCSSGLGSIKDWPQMSPSTHPLLEVDQLLQSQFIRSKKDCFSIDPWSCQVSSPGRWKRYNTE